MSRDLKDLIDTVEEKTNSQAELEATITSLKEKINKLNFTIKEQQLLIENQQGQIKTDHENLPSEVDILKDTIIFQREELTRRDDEINVLNERIDELTEQLEGFEKGDQTSRDKEELINAQKLIIQLAEENEQDKSQVEELKLQIEKLQSEVEELQEAPINDTPKEENEELVNVKKLNFQLMEENGLLRVEIESLKTQLQEGIEAKNQYSLKLANEKIEQLTSELEDSETLVKYLQEELEASNELTNEIASNEEELQVLKETLSRYQNENKQLNDLVLKLREELDVSNKLSKEFVSNEEELKELKDTMSRYQDENKQLNDLVLKLRKNISIQFQEENSKLPIAHHFPNYFQISLLKRMYYLLEKTDKEVIIDLLIKDLNSNNNDIKRFGIKILSEIKDERVYDAFLEMIHDQDWLVRYNLIKALSKFEIKNEKFKELLKKLSKDVDVDVRELAIKMLDDISQ